MSALTEIQTLKQEEKVLKNIASKLKDQLNRLKVEELALVNMMRVKDQSQQEMANQDFSTMDSHHHDQELEEMDINNQPLIDLAVGAASSERMPGEQDTGEEEESEEEEDDTIQQQSEQLTLFMDESGMEVGDQIT